MILFTFAETYQGRGGLQPSPSLESASYLEAHSNFPNPKSYFEAHNIKILVGFFLLPFKRFRFFFCNPLVDYNTNITLYLEKTKLIQG